MNLTLDEIKHREQELQQKYSVIIKTYTEKIIELGVICKVSFCHVSFPKYKAKKREHVLDRMLISKYYLLEPFFLQSKITNRIISDNNSTFSLLIIFHPSNMSFQQSKISFLQKEYLFTILKISKKENGYFLTCKSTPQQLENFFEKIILNIKKRGSKKSCEETFCDLIKYTCVLKYTYKDTFHGFPIIIIKSFVLLFVLILFPILVKYFM